MHETKGTLKTSQSPKYPPKKQMRELQAALSQLDAAAAAASPFPLGSHPHHDPNTNELPHSPAAKAALVAAAIQSLSQTACMDCPPHLVGLLIGKKGWTIKKIQSETGAQVSGKEGGCVCL